MTMTQGSEFEPCGWCGERSHYLRHICPGCTCHYTEQRIPDEPHIPAYLEAEQNPDCPLHGDHAETEGTP